MKKKLAIIILDGSGTQVRQLATSRLTIAIGVCLVVLLLAGGAAIFRDYGVKKQQLARRGALQKALAEKQSLIREQQKHLNAFSKQLNSLSQSLAELGNVEENIRLIANLEPNHAQENVFGIGGSATEGYEGRGDVESEIGKQAAEDPAAPRASAGGSYEKSLSPEGTLRLDRHPNLLAATPSIQPAGGMITACFKRSMSDLTGREEFHRGLDIVNEQGTPVVATADGRITFVGSRPAAGKTVVIDHGFGYVTEYTHLGEVFKQAGEQVRRGEQIGTMGASGQGKVSRLHYEVHLNGIPVDPSRYILQ